MHEHLSGFTCAWQTDLAVHARQPHCWTASQQLAACLPETPAEQSDCKPGCRSDSPCSPALSKLLSGLFFAIRPAPWPANPARLTQAMPSSQVFQMLSEHQRTDPHPCLRWPPSGLPLAHHPADRSLPSVVLLPNARESTASVVKAATSEQADSASQIQQGNKGSSGNGSQPPVATLTLGQHVSCSDLASLTFSRGRKSL